jgi:MFS family permease
MHALGLSEGTFGAAQLVPSLVAVALMLGGGPLCGWAGTKRLTGASLGLLAASVLALAGAGGVPGFLAALAVFGAGVGLAEVAVNGAALDWEQATGRAAMNALHAGFSAGAVVGALGAGALLGLGWRYGAVLVALAALCAPVLLATVPARFPDPGPGDRETPGLVATLRLLAGRPVLVTLAFLAALGVVGESVANTWSVIHLRAVGAPVLVGAVAYALFNAAMLVGRLANGRLVARLGARASLRLSGIGLVLSAACLLVPESVGFGVASFVMLGLAVAGVIPTVLSAAARLVPASSGAVAGAIMATAYIGFIASPPLVGMLAELLSLQVALLSVGIGGLVVLRLARGLPDA